MTATTTSRLMRPVRITLRSMSKHLMSEMKKSGCAYNRTFVGRPWNSGQRRKPVHHALDQAAVKIGLAGAVVDARKAHVVTIAQRVDLALIILDEVEEAQQLELLVGGKGREHRVGRGITDRAVVGP